MSIQGGISRGGGCMWESQFLGPKPTSTSYPISTSQHERCHASEPHHDLPKRAASTPPTMTPCFWTKQNQVRQYDMWPPAPPSLGRDVRLAGPQAHTVTRWHPMPLPAKPAVLDLEPPCDPRVSHLENHASHWMHGTEWPVHVESQRPLVLEPIVAPQMRPVAAPAPSTHDWYPDWGRPVAHKGPAWSPNTSGPKSRKLSIKRWASHAGSKRCSWHSH